MNWGTAPKPRRRSGLGRGGFIARGEDVTRTYSDARPGVRSATVSRQCSDCDTVTDDLRTERMARETVKARENTQQTSMQSRWDTSRLEASTVGGGTHAPSPPGFTDGSGP